jgi:multiple antibiotic resistance protein
MGTTVQIFVDSLYILALLNPVSKISVLSTVSLAEGTEELRPICVKSSVIAAIILILTMIFGDFILRRVFHIELHSLQIAGGFVLLWVGFKALQRGVFFERDVPSRFADIAIVPLACPMIAGPAAITASLALGAHRGLFLAVSSVLIALLINLAVMLLAKAIAAMLARFNFLGALIRITGLIVMTMGVQMSLDGVTHWIKEYFG